MSQRPAVIREHNDVRYIELYSTRNVKRTVVEIGGLGVVALLKQAVAIAEETGGVKFSFHAGRMSEDLTIGSYKYGPECQTKYYTRELPKVNRRTEQHNGYNRVGIYQTLEEGKRRVRALK